MEKQQKILSVLLLLVLLFSLSACTQEKKGGQSEGVRGTANAAGSSAMAPLCLKASAAFIDDNPDALVTVNAGGSGKGLSQLADGSIDMGNSDVPAEKKLSPDQVAELVDHKVAIMTVAAIVHKDNPVKNLSKKELAAIFSGAVKNWKEVGGKDLPIILITRPDSSGTRAVFQQWALEGAEESKEIALETDNSGELIQSVGQNPGAISYVSLPYLKGRQAEAVHPLSIDGVEASLENSYQGKYPVWGFEHIYTRKDPGEPTSAYIQFILSDDFSARMEEMGYGVVSKMEEAAIGDHQ